MKTSKALQINPQMTPPEDMKIFSGDFFLED